MPHSLISMARSPAEIKEEKAEIVSDPEINRFPWGLSINLEDESLTKLGITTLPKVGDMVQIVAVAKIDRVSESENNRGTDRSVSLQIEEMALEPAGPEKDAAEVLFGKGDKV